MNNPPAFPQQPLVWDDSVIRFRENRIVRYLLDAGPFDLNQLALMPFDRDEREQFAQLIGYSVSSWGGLSYVDDERVAEADAKAEAMLAEREKRLG